jgi:hypothetical protein
MCKSWCELIIALVILVVAMWPALLGASISNWVIIVAAIVLAIHSFTCKSCFNSGSASKRKR